MANVWMHNGFLQVESEKMSKSLGNFVTINELLATDKFGGRPWHGAVLRFAMLQSHYRQPMDWTVDKLKQSRTELFSLSFAAGNANLISQSLAEVAAGIEQPIDEEIVHALCDDLNTSLAITRLRELAKEARNNTAAAKKLLVALKFLGIMDEKSIQYFHMAGPITDVSVGQIVHEKDDGTTIERLRVAQANGQLQRVAELAREIESWGVSLRFLPDGTFSIESRVATNRGRKVEELIEDRNAARARKDFKESDRIRDELAAMGVVLKDGKDVDGKPVTTWEIAR
jgi:cysteinyl-tRNA synthetase